eukprot:sb/3462277/
MCSSLQCTGGCSSLHPPVYVSDQCFDRGARALRMRIANRETSLQVLLALEASSEEFRVLLWEADINHLESVKRLFEKPIQRLQRLPVFLQHIHEKTPLSHTDKNNLEAAHRKLLELLENINKYARVPSLQRQLTPKTPPQKPSRGKKKMKKHTMFDSATFDKRNNSSTCVVIQNPCDMNSEESSGSYETTFEQQYPLSSDHSGAGESPDQPEEQVLDSKAGRTQTPLSLEQTSLCLVEERPPPSPTFEACFNNSMRLSPRMARSTTLSPTASPTTADGDRKRWEVRPSSPGVIELQRQEDEDEWLFDEREFYGVSDGGTASESLEEFDLRSKGSELELSDVDQTQHPTGTVCIRRPRNKSSSADFILQETSLQVLLALESSSEEFRVLLWEADINHLESVKRLFEKPIQRLQRLPVFLQHIHEKTPLSHTDKNNLEAAQRKLLELLENINKYARVPSLQRQLTPKTPPQKPCRGKKKIKKHTLFDSATFDKRNNSSPSVVIQNPCEMNSEESSGSYETTFEQQYPLSSDHSVGESPDQPEEQVVDSKTGRTQTPLSLTLEQTSLCLVEERPPPSPTFEACFNNSMRLSPRMTRSTTLSPTASPTTADGDRKRWEVRPSSPGVIELQRQEDEDEWLFDEREFYGVSDGGTASDSLEEFDLRSKGSELELSDIEHQTQHPTTGTVCIRRPSKTVVHHLPLHEEESDTLTPVVSDPKPIATSILATDPRSIVMNVLTTDPRSIATDPRSIATSILATNPIMATSSSITAVTDETPFLCETL